MQCIKTGCNAHIVQTGEYVHGDAFQTPSGDLVIRCCHRDREPIGPLHFTVNRYDHWFDETKTSMDRNSTLFALAGGFENHGYEGKAA